MKTTVQTLSALPSLRSSLHLFYIYISFNSWPAIVDPMNLLFAGTALIMFIDRLHSMTISETHWKSLFSVFQLPVYRIEGTPPSPGFTPWLSRLPSPRYVAERCSGRWRSSHRFWMIRQEKCVKPEAETFEQRCPSWCLPVVLLLVLQDLIFLWEQFVYSLLENTYFWVCIITTFIL